MAAVDVVFKDPFSRRLESLSNGDIKTDTFRQGVFCDTNEENLESIAYKLGKQAPPQKSVHVGFSGLYNFDVMGSRRSKRGIICDINPDNAKVVNFALSLLCKDVPKEEFKDKILEWCLEEGIDCATDCAVDREACWLVNDESFQHLKMLAREGKIAVLTANICDLDRFKKIRQLFEDNSIFIDTLYLSNICHYLNEEPELGHAMATIKSLSERETQIIYTVAVRSLGQPFPFQEVGSRDSFDLESVFLKGVFKAPLL